MDSLTAKVNVLKNAWHEFILGILDSDGIKLGVDILTGLFNVLNNLTGLAGPLSGLVKALTGIGLFMGGRALVQSGISAISGGLAGAVGAGTAAAAGAGATGAATAAAAAKAGAVAKTGKSGIGAMMAAMVGGQAISGMLSNAKNAVATKAINAKNILGALALGVAPDVMSSAGDKLRANAANAKDSNLKSYYEKGAKYYDDKEAENRRKQVKNIDKQQGWTKGAFASRAGALAQVGAGGLADIVSTLGAIPGPAMAAAAAIGAVGSAILISNHIHQKYIDNMNELVERQQEAEQTYKDNKAALTSLEEEYNTLSKGVDRNGKNIGLSAEQYERYKEVAQEIADISPEVVESVDIEGNVILKDDAIKEAQESLDFNMELQNASFSSEAGLNTLIKGVQASTFDIREKYSDSAKEFNKLIEDNSFSGTKTTPKANGTVETEIYGEEILGKFDKKSNFTPKGPAIKGYVSPASYSATTEDLEDLYDERYEVLSEAREDLTDIAEKFGTDSEEYQDAINDYYSLQGLIDQGGDLKAELKEARQPIIDSLKNFATSDRDLSTKGVQSLADEVAKDNQQFFSNFIEDTALNDDLTATQMHDYVQYASEQLSTSTNFGKELSDSFNNITEAKEAFDDSARDTEAIEEYNKAIEDNVTEIEDKIQELRDVGTDEANALADSLESELYNLKDYAQETKMTLSEAFNDMSDEISKANKVKEEYDIATSGGDYYTGRQSFKEIYDDITSDVNFAGKGSQSFWSGAELMLDQKWIRENAGNIDTIKKKVKSLEPMLKDGKSGADAFMKTLYNLDNLEEYGIFKDRNGFALDFSEWDDSNLEGLAEALGISSDFLTSMLNNARQFSNINFSNIDTVVSTMKDNGIGVETKEGKRAVSRSKLQKESGLNVPEFEDWANQEDTKEQIILVDYQLKDKNSLKNFADQIEEISPSVFSGGVKKGASDLTGLSLNLDDFISASYMLGATQDETTEILQEFSKQGVEIKGQKSGESLEQAVENGFETFDIEDPLTSASGSMDKASAAMMALVGVLGGPFDTQGAAQTRKDFKAEHGDKYESTKEGADVYDFRKWTNDEYKQAQEDYSNAKTLQERNQASADKATEDGRTEEAKKYQAEADYYERYASNIKEGISQQDEYNTEGGTVNINGKEYTKDEIDFLTRDRKGRTAQDIEDEYNRQDPGHNQLSSDIPAYAKAMSQDLSTTGKLGYIGEVAKANLEIEIANAGGVENLVNEITELTGADHEVVVDALTAAAEGDVTAFNNVLDDLPPETQAEIISLLTGQDPNTILGELEDIDGENPTSHVTIEGDDYQSPVPEEQDSYVNYITNGLTSMTSETKEAIDDVTGKPTAKLGNASALTAQVRSALSGSFSINVKANVTGLPKQPAAKGMNRPAINYGSVAKGHHFGSVAKGHTEGIVGPRGNGGMTLTGELGPELVWLPSQNASFMVGEGGPQLVPLPSDAVVYPAHITKNIVDQDRPVTKFGTTSGGYNFSNPSPSPTHKTTNISDNSKGSGNASKAGTKEDKWKNDLDWLYNLLEDINEVVREREKLEHRYERLIENRNASLSDLIKLQKEQLKNLKLQKELEEERLEKRKQEMREYLEENSDLASKYEITYNWDDNTIEINWDKIDAITDSDEGDKVKDMIDRLEEIQDDMDDAEDSLMDIEEEIDEIKKQGEDEYFDIEERIIDALEQIAQNEIDRLEEINDSIKDADNNLLNSIQEAVDEQRRARDNQKTEDELGKLQRRLAYLRQDTSGMNDLEIKQLEEQLKEQQEDYGDSLVDQKLDEMQKQNEKASEQRERQIQILEEQLTWNKESGAYAQQARDILLAARNNIEDGIPIEKTQLYEIITAGENWQSESWAKQLENWDELLVGTAQALAYLDNRENINYMAEMQKWFKVLNDPNSTEEDKSMARSKIAILEKQRNQKIIEEELEKIYPTTDRDYTKVAYESDVSNYMADMQKALAANDMKALKESEKLRNIKLELSGRESEKTNFHDQALKAQNDEVSLATSEEEGYVDYMAKLEEALKAGNFDEAYYWELMRDKKITQGNLNAKTTGGSITLDAMKNWNAQPQTQQTQQAEPTYKKVSELWNGTFTITRQTTGEIVKAITGALKGMGLYNGSVSDSFTDESYKALRVFAGISSGLEPFYFGPKTMDRFKVKGYKIGGLADYTGPAWLDGTPSKPELVLNPRDTNNFIQLKDVLSDFMRRKTDASKSNNKGNNYFDININVDKISNDYDVEQMADKIKKIIHKDSMYRNVNAINFLR